MIYLEPSSLGWRPVLQSWINKLPEMLRGENEKVIKALFEWVCPPLLYFVRKNCKVSQNTTLKYKNHGWIQQDKTLYNLFLYRGAMVYYYFIGVDSTAICSCCKCVKPLGISINDQLSFYPRLQEEICNFSLHTNFLWFSVSLSGIYSHIRHQLDPFIDGVYWSHDERY